MEAKAGPWLAALALLGACTPLTGWSRPGGAPPPLRPIQADRFYAGRWYEIERTPMRITRNCVAGTTDYSRLADGRILDSDVCHMAGPQGRLKSFVGPVTLLDPGRNTQLRVSYIVWHFFRVPWVYWIFDHDEGYRWFILSDPSFEHVSLFSRVPRPSDSEVTHMRDELRQWGYDVSKLERPTQYSVP
jgi:apolipoprotein D and lipocalin family protein